MDDVEEIINNAQRITLGQVDNGTLATAVTCGETLAIARHGRVESYLVPKHIINEMLMKNAVLECDNKRLLGEKVAKSITVPTSHDFKFPVDLGAVTSCDMPRVSESMRTIEISRRLRLLEKEPSALWDELVFARHIFNQADFNRYFMCEFEPVRIPTSIKD